VVETKVVVGEASPADVTYGVVRAEESPVIDGSAGEWGDVPAIHLDRREQTGGQWSGPEDLSAAFRSQWDDGALYFCVEVTDDVHSAPGRDSGLWENDAIQFAFDAYSNGPAGEYDIDELSFCVADSPQGPQLYSFKQRNFPYERGMPVPGQEAAISCEGSRCTYEWSMDWETLKPVSPWLIGSSGFSFTLNDNDGSGFVGALLWGQGILWGQDASAFGRVTFEGDREGASAFSFVRPENSQLGLDWLDFTAEHGDHLAAIMVRSAVDGEVEAVLRVLFEDGSDEVATGRLCQVVESGKTYLLRWNLADLDDGTHKLSYDVAGAVSADEEGLVYPHFVADRVLRREEELREKFGLDRPWDDMENASPWVRKHRGMVAVLLNWMTNREPGLLQTKVSLLAEAAGALPALEGEADYLGSRRNEFWSAYYCPADASGQFFVAAVPDQYDDSRRYPLVVDLHGRGQRPRPDKGAVHEHDYIEVKPWGRGDQGYLGLANNDVISTIEYMKRWYSIDEDRVYLLGRSMGGGGTWTVATRQPDLFAAIAPIYGYPIYDSVDLLTGSGTTT